MDYQQLIKGLIAEVKRGVRYNEWSLSIGVLAFIVMLPITILAFFGIIAYYASLFLYNAIISPIHYLEHWQQTQVKELHFVPQAVIYLITMPFIFSLRVLVAFSCFSFYFQWFSLQVLLYLCTYGGIKFQPWISNATFDQKCSWLLKPYSNDASAKFILVLVGFVALILFGAMIGSEWLASLATFLYFIGITIINPIILQKVEVTTENKPEPSVAENNPEENV